MSRSLNQILRPLVPNIKLRIRHVEPEMKLTVNLRQHIGLIARGAKSYESRYVDVLRHCVQPNDTVIDVGANIGFYTVLFSRWVGEQGIVVAYEPDPANVRLLQQNLKGCDNTTIRQVALGSVQEETVFSLDKITGATGHLGRGATYGETALGSGKEFLMKIKTKTLDSEIEDYGRPDLIKLDVEGGEYDVLSGGSKVLKDHRPILISELSSWVDDGAQSQSRPKLLVELLRETNYKIWNLDSGAPLSSDDEAWMILAIPQERLEENRMSELLNFIVK